ncbi:TniQ family protein [Paracoccus sp. AK26]|uniref:TniQ family protein n=1 Tax=Paracoccus sp. AK26 TaxID=2589076 RepID=UPI00142FB38A|nr:TniQ family protein [Paracoccus sp. AK26]
MTQLFPKVLIEPEETLFSYLGRSAAFHAKTELVPFLNDFRVRVRDVETGSNGAMERLAELTGQRVDKLTAIHMFSTANRRFRFRGENFGYQFLTRSRRSVCPHCLEEEGGLSPYPGFQRWRVKLLWQFKFCPVCTVHETQLVNAWDKSVGFVPMQDVVKAVGDRLPSLIAATRPGKVTSLQRWVASRLLGEKGDSWLDAQDIDQASKAVEMLGLILAHGPKAHLRKLTESDWHEAKEVGFEVASAGPGTIKKSLEHLLDRVQTGRKLQWAPQAHLGPLYHWLYQDDAVSLEAGC